VAQTPPKFSEEQIAYLCAKFGGWRPVGDVCQQVGVSEATFYL
jgi:hypothetical protein